MDFLLPEYKQLLTLLLKHNVNFMLIGGYAVIYYGYERTTTDLDIWLEPDNSNRDKLLRALTEFGIDDKSTNTLSKEDFTTPQLFYFGNRPRRIDFLTKIKGVTYKEAAAEINHFAYNDLKIPIIQYHHLIRSKITNERPQDKADVEMLQKIRQLKGKN